MENNQENNSAIVPVNRDRILEQMEFLEDMYAAKGRNTNIAFDASKALSLFTVYAGITTAGVTLGGTLPVWLLGLGCYGVASVFQKLTTGRTAIIPFTNLDFGTAFKAAALSHAKKNGTIPEDAVGDYEAERYDYQGMITLENKVAYLLCSEWRALCLPYLELRETEEEVNNEFRRLVEWVKVLPNVRRFVDNLELIEETHHGSFGPGKGAFIRWATQELDRKYAARAMRSLPVHFPTEELDRANRSPQVIELEEVEDAPLPLLMPSEDEPKTIDVQPTRTSIPTPSTAIATQGERREQHQTKIQQPTTKIQTNKPLGSRTKVVDLAKALVNPVAKTVIIGNPGSGKGFTMAHAVIEFLKKYPNAQVFFVDPKADPGENYLSGIIPDSHIFSQRLPDPLLAKDGEIQDWFQDLKDFISVYQIVPSSVENPKLLIFDETLNCKNVLEGMFGPVVKKLIDIATTGRSRGEIVWLMSQADNCKDWGMSASNLKLFRRVAVINNIEDHKDYNPDLFKSRADFFAEKIGAEDYSKRLLRTSDRIAYDSYGSPVWFVQGALPPLKKVVPPDGVQPKTNSIPDVDLDADPWEDEEEPFDEQVHCLAEAVAIRLEESDVGKEHYTSTFINRFAKLTKTMDKKQINSAMKTLQDWGMIKIDGKKFIVVSSEPDD